MYDFIYNLWFIYNEFCMMGMREKARNIQKKKKNEYENQGKMWLPSNNPIYEMEADCFPVPENTENKPDLPKVGEGS